jgi:hexosaminidase
MTRGRTLTVLLAALGAAAHVESQALVPEPSRMVVVQGSFVLGRGTRIVASGDARSLGERLRDNLRPATGLPLTLAASGEADVIRLRLDSSAGSLGPEGYRLVVRPARVDLQAATPAGLFYGIQTLRQLLPPAIFREARVDGVAWMLPAVSIEDAPRFAWRGSHLDAGRYFMPKGFIKRHLDLMALHKLNVFHWHLTEDQGWRLEIKKYPKLTAVGAWRRETLLPAYEHEDRPNQMRFDNTPHGGFYTQDDAREIVRYAAERFITVVPEIEMPGHSTAAVASYPELGNFPERPIEVGRTLGIFTTVFNTEDRTLSFLKDVLDEVMAIFPSPYLHIGGDECPKAEWAASERALERMKQAGIVPPETTLDEIQNYRDAQGLRADHPALPQLQSWFVRQIDAHINSRGRRLIGWDEILEGGLAPGAAVMSWRGEEGGIAAARAGHDVVMAPQELTYLNHYQSAPPSPEPFGREGILPLARVYAYEPVPATLSPEQATHVLGAQGQLWTNYLSTPKQVEYMLWPRLAALAERLWSRKEQRDFDDFERRLKLAHLGRLEALDVGFRPLDGARAFPR